MYLDNNSLGQPIGFLIPDWKAPPFPTHEPMEGQYCRLEKLDPNLHAISLYAANSIDTEGRMWTYLPIGPFTTFESYRLWVEEICCSSERLFFAIIDKVTEKAIGVASYLRIDPSIGSIEVGWIGYSPLLQRTTAGTEAMFLMMNKVFTLGYRRYEWKCNALNAPSRRAAQRLGFSFEGVFRQATIVKGRNRDTAWFSIIDVEWSAIKKSFEIWLQPENFDETGKQSMRLSELVETTKSTLR